MRTKVCSKCNQRLPVTDFWRHNRANGDGYQAYCKPCAKRDRRERRQPTGPTPRRRGNAGLKQVGLWIDPRAHAAVKAAAARFNITMSEIVEQAIALRMKVGFCVDCGAPPVPKTTLCTPCITRRRTRGAA